MKNTSKFLLCFRPVDVDMEMIVDSKHARRPRTKLIENTKAETLTMMEQEVQSPLTKTMSLDRDCSMILTSHNSKLSRSLYSRTLAKVLKAVAFETTLEKKVRDNKAFRQHSLENDELMTTPSKINNSHEVRIKQSTKNQEDPDKKSKKKLKGSCEFNYGMYLLLVSLGVTVFSGRVFAILFTSIWLYFLSLRCVDSHLRRLENVRKRSEAELREKRRRVIMEGLIERSHHSQRGHKFEVLCSV